MASYPLDIRRCRHIKTNGTQCGSPALKDKELCFYHDQNRPRAADIYLDGELYSDWSVVIPVLEDAHSIQTVIQQVVQMMLARRIDRKDAGLLLYALQIASGNLKTMQAEKPSPTQMVVEPEKAGETPLGMTPWSASGKGHDPEDGEEEDGEQESEAQNTPAPPPTADELYASVTVEQRTMFREKWAEQGWLDPQELEDYLLHDGHDPFLLTARRMCAERDRKLRAEAGNLQSAGHPPAAGGSVQACHG